MDIRYMFRMRITVLRSSSILNRNTMFTTFNQECATLQSHWTVIEKNLMKIIAVSLQHSQSPEKKVEPFLTIVILLHVVLCI